MNKNTQMHIFLDFEASSLSGTSYPIEVAWADHQGRIENHLINAQGYPEDYNDWSKSAEGVHGLSRQYLIKHGEDPLFVAQRMNSALNEAHVFTTAPDYDGFWCRRLFSAVNLELTFKFGDIETVLKKILPIEYWISDNKSGSTHINALYRTAREQCGLSAHRASNDVAHLIECYRLARQWGGYY